VSWLSPLGWAQQVRPFAGDRWWALAVPLVATATLTAFALALLRRRDLGAGVLVDRPGPARAPRLRTAFSLAWRLQRWTLVAWAVGAALLGVMLGSIASTIADLLDNERFRDYLQLLGGVQFLEDAFLSTELTIAATIVSGYGISAALRMRSEEAQGRVEPLLVAGVDRSRFVVAHTGIALAGTTVLMALLGVCVGLAHGIAVGDADQVGRVLGAALARLPAVWVMTTLVLALFGLSGRLTVLAWVLLVGFIVVGEFGPLMDLPSWTLEISPFAHLPSLPGGQAELGPTAWLLALAAALFVVGVLAFQRRDLEPD
jgi:ABC-2 type transport system permease protein